MIAINMKHITFLLCSLFLHISPTNNHHKTGTIPAGAKKLIHCYGDFVAWFSGNELIFKDKSRMIWDDGIKNKSIEQILDKPDLKDMFAQKYTIGELGTPPPVNFDPGRTRNQQFFEKMYGATPAEVKSHLTEIIWCPKLVNQKIMVTTVNGVDKKLAKISQELDEHPELKKYLTNIAGTFSWRNIKGTSRHSMHSYGMTIDINTTYSDYWEWACKCTTENIAINYQNRIPQVIVNTFEKHGFIWGGKWYHYDTMHFEYRPELLP